MENFILQILWCDMMGLFPACIILAFLQSFSSIYLFFLFCFLGPHPRHVEVPRLGVELELQLLAYATATAVRDLSHVCDLHHSSWQHWILNPLSGARDRTHVLMDASQNHSC